MLSNYCNLILLTETDSTSCKGQSQTQFNIVLLQSLLKRWLNILVLKHSPPIHFADSVSTKTKNVEYRQNRQRPYYLDFPCGWA